MKVLLINPPYRSRIIRRYVCSYNAPNFLFPPLELMALSAQAKLVEGCEVRLMDCIAEGASADVALTRVREFQPDIVVAIMAIEYFDNDVRFLKQLKIVLPERLVGCFGHLPSHFSRETLDATGADFVLVGEPDTAFRSLLERHSSEGEAAGEGVAVMAGGEFTPAAFQRLSSLDELPFADQSAINHSLYGEPFFGHPYTTFLSSRGCPFPCSYCVRTFGRDFEMESASRVAQEVAAAVSDHGIKYFRFMDDTFTASRRRVLEICTRLRDLEMNITWSCLSRPNTIDSEVAEALRSAGCRRVYVGIESGSQKVLDYLKRGYQLEKIMDNLREVRRSGLEMVGWFIVGAPVESREDFEASLKLARELKLEYVAVSSLVPYPETELFERERNNIEFSLLPYVCRFRNGVEEGREAEFYRRYYMSPAYIARRFGSLVRHPGESLKAAGDFLRYVVASRRDPHRKDML